jgi:DNA-binding transcriptional regulator GbsR (MarR family)
VLARGVLTNITDAARQLPLSEPTIATALRHLEDLEIVRELTGRRRNRIWVYTHYLAILNEGTEPIGGGSASDDDGATRHEDSIVLGVSGA